MFILPFKKKNLLKKKNINKNTKYSFYKTVVFPQYCKNRTNTLVYYVEKRGNTRSYFKNRLYFFLQGMIVLQLM